MKYIKQFNLDVVSEKVNNSDSLYLYEINTPGIKKYVKQHKYIWLHLWKPYCPGERCQNIGYFSNISGKFQNQGMELLLISETYCLRDIKKVVAHSSYDKPIFVLQDSYYGQKTRKNRVKLFNEINNNLSINSKCGFSDYLFKDTLLIFAGGNITEEMLDSLIASNPLRIGASGVTQ